MTEQKALMEALDCWRLCDELSVVQAALLIVGEDPSELQHEVELMNPTTKIMAYEGAKAALTNAIKGKRLPANVTELKSEWGDYVEIDLHRTTIAVEDLREWLRSRGFEKGFFFPVPKAGPDYLSKNHPNYSAKLAAAINAWQAVSADPELRQGKSVKQALDKWLRQHANDFGLTKDDGNPNDHGIEEVAKIANWDTKGGAPKTPGNE